MEHFTDPAKMTPAWRNEHCEAAQREGWDIFDTQGSDGGPWQIQRFDDASEVPGAPQLKSDDAAWAIALKGTAQHHEAARQFIQAHNPKEWTAFKARNATADESEVVVKLADGCTLRSGVYNPHSPDALTAGEYVRLCDPNGDEILYWDQDEWATDPALVMGAIINAAAGFRVEKAILPINKIACYVHVTGEATDADDDGVQGFYLVELSLARHLKLDSLTEHDKTEIAKAVLDSFHDSQGIEVLDDFLIKVHLSDGTKVEDDAETSEVVLVLNAAHCGKVNESDLPFALPEI